MEEDSLLGGQALSSFLKSWILRNKLEETYLICPGRGGFTHISFDIELVVELVMNSRTCN